MLKIIFILIIVFSIHPVEIFADIGIKSGFDKSGNFNNRLQFDGEYMDLSLLSSISISGLEWIEPALFMKSLYIGRIQLKGIVREFNNPDGNSPSASVLTENSGLRVTDSMSRSSRYGILLTPFENYDFSGWIYRANSGLFSVGMMYSQPELFSKSVFSIDGDIMVAAGGCEECSDSGWFSGETVLPCQLGFNTALEFRIKTDECCGGRRSLLPSGDKLAWSLSIAASGSLPQYTLPGGLFRAVTSAGVKNLYLSGFFQYVSSDYISAAGDTADYRLISGACLCGSAFGDLCGISGELDYCLKQKMPEIIPARFVAQHESIGGQLELSAGMFILKLEADCCSDYESSGVELIKTSINTSLKFDADIIALDAGCDLDYESEYSLVNQQSPNFDGGVLFSFKDLKLGFRCGYGDEILSYEMNTGLVTETYKISGSIEIDDGIITGLAIGFEI